MRVKVVPGASRDRVMGRLGDRLKIAVAAVPEAGKANAAVCKLLAGVLGIPSGRVSVAVGDSSPMKTLLIEGMTVQQVLACIDAGGS